MSRFKCIEITNFNNCNGCPFRWFNETQRQDFMECGRLGEHIVEYRTQLCGGDIDHRNEEGVLHNCPFLKDNTLTIEDE